MGEKISKDVNYKDTQGRKDTEQSSGRGSERSTSSDDAKKAAEKLLKEKKAEIDKALGK